MATSGTVVEGACTTCDSTVHYLKLPGTGQMFELAERLPVGEVELKAQVDGWETLHPRLVVID